jgi:4-amino-4-deoxy-L-arabinose transferase-like glycosyltransferase
MKFHGGESTGKNDLFRGVTLLLKDRYLDMILIALILIFSFYVRFISLSDPGITWDEGYYVHAGITYVDNIFRLDFTHPAWNENIEQPPVGKYLYGATIWLFNGGLYNYDAYIVSKATSAMMGAVTCVLVYMIGIEFFDRRIALVSAAILALMPDFVAHTQIAALDAPVALFFTLTIYLFMKALKNNNPGYYIASAVSLGLLIDTKFTGILAIPIMVILYILQRLRDPSVAKEAEAVANAGKKLLPLHKIDTYLPIIPIACFFAITAFTMYLVWPWVWNSPYNFGATLKHWTLAVPREYFFGHLQPTPIYYYPVYFLITTPALLFIPLALGVYAFIRSRDIFKYSILLWFLIPFIYDVSTFKQNGMRYLLMIYPAVAVLCAAGIWAVARWIGAHWKNKLAADVIFFGISALAVVYLLFSLASVYPYYLDYYNELVGGPAGAYENSSFEVGYWGEGIYDSVMYIEAHAKPGSTVLVTMPNQWVNVYGKNETYILPSGEVCANDTVDYIINNAYFERHGSLSFNRSDYGLIYETKVQGVPLVKVYGKIT